MNQVNRKRFDDLKPLDDKMKIDGDVLKRFLERETSASKIHLHEVDARNELLNKDLLKDMDKINKKNYQTPLRVIEKYN